MKYSDFFKNFPYKIKRQTFSEITVIYDDDVDFSINIKTLEVTFGFRPYDYGLKPGTLASLTKQIKSKFYGVDKRTMYVQAPPFRWLSYRLFLNKIEDLNQIFEILNPILLLGKLSRTV